MIGRILGNRYEIIEKVGGGGMAIVYKAKCKLLNRFVAVKVLRDELTEDQEFIKRFNIESQSAASLSHPNIVSIYDVGEEDGIHYIVMEYVDGITLKELINKNKALPWKEALNYAAQICSGLEHAHKNHIIHRDIKPHNILITNDGIAKVTDFGIARAVTSSTLTLGGNTIGSVHYFSPEQARGGYIDEKSDIYSLGVVLYEMLTGKLPFYGESPVAVAMKHVQEKPIPPREIKEDIPQALQAIILKAMDKEQNRRYNSATVMLKDLYKAFDQPYSNFVEGKNMDDLPTQKIPIIDMHDDEEEPKNKKMKKNLKKEDKNAIIAAIITSVFIISILSVFGYNLVKGYLPISNKAEEQSTPDLVGKDFESIKSFYDDPEKFIIEIEKRLHSKEHGKGIIIEQDPASDTMVKLPQKIKVKVSMGAELIMVPPVVNKEYRQAEIRLESEGFDPEVIYEFHDTVPEGFVIKHVPEAGVEGKAGDIVKLYVSKGRDIQMVVVPNLVGMTADEAKRAINEAGLVVGNNISSEFSNKPKNEVIRQSLPHSTEVEEKTLIDFVISSGSPPVQGSNGEDKQTPQERETTIHINLPQDKETVTVEIKAYSNGQGKIIYKKTHKSAESPIPITLKGTGQVPIEIFFDGNLKAKETINFREER